MDSQIVIGLLGVAGTTIAPIIAWKLASHSENDKFNPISKARLELLEGKAWKGFLLLDGQDRNNVVVNFKVKNRALTGSATYEKIGSNTKIIFKGGFYSSSVIKLEYRNSEAHKFHFGTIILEMNGDADVLSGGLVAYGRSPDKIYYGQIQLKST